MMTVCAIVRHRPVLINGNVHFTFLAHEKFVGRCLTHVLLQETEEWRKSGTLLVGLLHESG
jgi:hypothetical protein